MYLLINTVFNQVPFSAAICSEVELLKVNGSCRKLVCAFMIEVSIFDRRSIRNTVNCKSLDLDRSLRVLQSTAKNRQDR